MTVKRISYKTILIDGANMMHRMRHAYHELASNVNETRTGVLYGTLNTISLIMRDWNPDEIIVALESPTKKLWRKKLYPDYKKQREAKIKSDPILAKELNDFNTVQVPDTLYALKNFGIPCIGINSFEADDVIAALTAIRVEQGCSVVIVSTDNDYTQLVTKDVRIFSPVKNVVYSVDSFGRLTQDGTIIAPSPKTQFYRQLLVGDVSDNIPGVPSCGHKTAIKLLDARPRQNESGIKYILRKTKEAVVSDSIKESVTRSKNVITLAENLRNLTETHPLYSILRAKAQEKLEETQRITKEDCAFISDKFRNADPSPLQTFFWNREFEFIKWSSDTQKIISDYTALFNRRKVLWE